MSRLRPFQASIKAAIFQGWQSGARNLFAESPTGSGKTVILADVVKTAQLPTAVVAHRSELVTQISTSLAREGVMHRIIGSDTVRKNCVTLHMRKFKRSFYDPSARVGVCSVDTLAGKKSDPWFHQVGLWVMDEAHHVLNDNKWGKACALFPNAYGLGVSAMAWRDDGAGLGRVWDDQKKEFVGDGPFDRLIKGPSMREMIDAGYLTDYKIFAPPSDIDYSQVNITASGDYSPVKLRQVVHASDEIVGDVVSHYKRICADKLGRLGLGVTFAVDVESAQEIAQAFREAGVPSEVVSAKTPDIVRADVLDRFARREVMQLVNVDLFGEGFDLPAIEVVSMVRKTESLQLFVQQFGRALRLMISDDLAARWGDLTDEQRRHFISISEKPFAIIIDHVGNTIRHGVPDAPRETSLARRTGRGAASSDAIPMRTCTNTDKKKDGSNEVCGRDYERFRKACPYCGHVEVPAERSRPEHVDGDLEELDAETLAKMRGKVIDLDALQPVPSGAAGVFATAQIHERKVAQKRLRDGISLWAGWQRHEGLADAEINKLFYLQYGVDILTAQSYGRGDAEALLARIQGHLNQDGVIAA